jgi:beta-galactosidase/beta-glucuronidase
VHTAPGCPVSIPKEDVLEFGYPRPQLVRKHWQSLNGKWKFQFDNELKYRHPTEIREWPLQIEVPFPPESKRSGIGDTGFHRRCWYEREFNILPEGGRIILHFGAVDYFAKVWVNNKLVVTHEGGHTPFWADITQPLNESGVQKVTVMVEDDPQDLTKPRGKQDWQLEPHSIWYPRTTGIWQTV